MFFDTFCQLCKNKGVSPNGAAKELSIASGTVSEWKKGRVPQNATLLKIADYFGVPVDTLLEGEDNPPEDARLISLMKTLTAEEKSALENFINYLIKKRK